MTGFYVRIKRGDRWETAEFDQLTDQELDDFTKAQPPKEGWHWAIALARWIRDNVHEPPCPADNEPTLDHAPR
jgi:hypothetical protein